MASAENTGNALRRTDAPLVIEDQINRLRHVVRDREQVHVPRTDELGFLQRHFHPLPQPLPVIPAKKDQRKARNALGLFQGDDLEEFIERAESTGHEDEAHAVFYETDFAREKIVKMDRDVGVAIALLFMG